MPMSRVLHIDEWMDGSSQDNGPEEFYVATTDDRSRGAAVIAYPGLLEEAVRIMGGSYYVLPSSIHEVLLLSAKTDFDYLGLEELVRDVNSSFVAEKERLSDHVYYYDADNGTFGLAAKLDAKKTGRQPCLIEQRMDM